MSEVIDPRVARTRVAGLAAARQVLIAEGWDAVTHARVAEAAGVGRATVYRHWPDRAALLRDALLDLVELTHIRPTGELRADLVAELTMLRRHLANAGLLSALGMLIERGDREPEWARLRREVARAGTSMLRTLLRAGVASGELRAGLDVERATAQLGGPLVYRRVVTGEAVSPAFVRAVVDEWLVSARA